MSKTTNVAVYGGSESILGQQLPYTPQLSGSLTAKVSLGTFSLAYLHQFRGERLDNAGKVLRGFQTGHVLLSLGCLQGHLTADFRLENLWNVQYEIIRYRPMPGIHGRLGLTYRL